MVTLKTKKVWRKSFSDKDSYDLETLQNNLKNVEFYEENDNLIDDDGIIVALSCYRVVIF